MPKHQEVISLGDINTTTIMPVVYETYMQLGWEIDFANNDRILATTKKGGQEILVFNENNELTIVSEMVHDELADVLGKNKKNVSAFIEKFSEVKLNIGEEKITANKTAITDLIEKTNIVIKQQEIETKEINEAMNLEGSNLYATYAIIAINVLVFILMIIDGAGLMAEDPSIHIKWGSNISTLTLSGDWWRLTTCTFIHFGIVHILMNMYSLYTVGVYLEPMLGKVKYVIAYLCTGIIASIVSLWWHSNPINSAGASGAVFGMYGLFLALLTSNLIPKSVRNALLKSIGIFVLYNLVYGMKSGIDNAAHIGGLISGFVIGYLFIIGIKQEKKGSKAVWVLPIVVIATLAISAFYITTKKASAFERDSLMNAVKNASFKDNDAFNEKYNSIIQMQDEASKIIDDNTLETELKKNKITTIVLPIWKEAEKIAEGMEKMNVSDLNKEKAKFFKEYIMLKQEEANLTIKQLNNEESAASMLNETILKINTVVEKLK